MPDFWSHRYAAQEALNDANRESHSQPLRFKTSRMYYYGAQGPDFFYYINQTKPFRKDHYSHIGNTLHMSNITDTIRHLILTAKDASSEDLWDYVAGYLTHYIMDVHCHPLICLWGPDAYSHKKVEMYLERLTIDAYMDTPLSKLPIRDIPVNRHSAERVYALLWPPLLDTYNIQAPEAILFYQASKDMKTIQRLLIHDIFSRLPFVKELSKLFHYDLTLLTLPQTSTNTHIDFKTYQHQFEKGIQETSHALLALEAVAISAMTIDAFINTYVTCDYLGKDIEDAAKDQ